MDSSLFQINTILSKYATSVDETMSATLKEVATETASELRATSPGDFGPYARSWDVKKQKGGKSYVVYNKEHYRLTHLLEKGHKSANQYGSDYGRVKAYPHIKKAEELAEQLLPETFEEKLKNVN
jgi:hypothetical protein